MPPGAMLMNPSRTMSSFYHEVIIRKPHIFKMGCLKQVMHLFPQSPFAGGFGNRPTDYISYESVQLPPERIFIIDPKSNIIQGEEKDTKMSYEYIDLVVPKLFPKILRP